MSGREDRRSFQAAAHHRGQVRNMPVVKGMMGD